MNILFNEQPLTLSAPCSLKTFLNERGLTDLGFAIALNQAFIPRANYSSVELKDQDSIIVLTAMCGG